VSFKAQAIADLPTFLNTSEFGDVVDIDADRVACVLVPDEALGASNNPGVSQREATLYLRASDQYATPRVDNRITVNDQQWTVSRVDEEQGMLVLRLGWFDS
jgi:hypothetical protein